MGRRPTGVQAYDPFALPGRAGRPGHGVRRIQRRTAPDLDPAFLPHRHPVLRRVLAARAVECESDLEHSLARLAPPDGLLDLGRAAALLDDAIESASRIVVAGHYDADGATGCAVAVRGLSMLGAPDVRFVVPDRRRHGYGLTPELVEVARAQRPRLIVTVDNGVSSVEGVARAKELGIDVLITDHHLPGAQLPAADAMVNPSVTSPAVIAAPLSVSSDLGKPRFINAWQSPWTKTSAVSARYH